MIGRGSQPDDATRGRTPTPAVVLLAPNATERRRLRQALAPYPLRLEPLATPAQVEPLLASGQWDVLLIGSGLPHDDVQRVLASPAARHGVVSIVLAPQATADDLVALRRAGADDFVIGRDSRELVERIRAAADLAARRRLDAQRLERLRRACHHLRQSRRDLTRQIGSLCNDLVEAYEHLADQLTRVGVATEFASLVRQELDIESLLRTALEFILAKIGPTNAAVFLPSCSRDFTLGAYVNYDWPTQTTDILLEQLANVLAPRMEDRPGVLLLAGARPLRELLGDSAAWLGDAAVLTFACRYEGECLAVVALFRDRHTGFSDDAVALCRWIADLFARQLSRVIHVHNRHVPRDQWGFTAGRDDDEDLDAAA